MAASEESCDGNPNFAIICSFITKFGDDCGVNIPIPDLQQMLEDTKNVHEDLQELLIHLLRRGRKRVNKERWEKCLIKFCHEYSSVDAWEIERFGFLKSKLSVKLELLKRLLELQFDANAKFKAEVNKHDASSLRILPLGRDIDGQSYWYQLDKEYNMRLYRETIGENGEWKLLCSTTEDLRTLLTSLQKKYSGSSGEACENKLNDSDNPKSPSSDKLVPKKELDSEDLTSHLSETKPCTIIIKTERKECLSHTEMPDCAKNDNFAIVSDTSNKMEVTESESNSKVCVKLKLKKEPSSSSKIEQKSNKDVLDGNTIDQKDTVPLSDPEPMSVEITKAKETDAVLPSDSVCSNDVEMKEVDDIKVDKNHSDEHTDQKISSDKTDSAVDTEKLESVNQHKSSKIKLYEKWSNEKKKLDANRLNAEDSNANSKMSSAVEEKEQCNSLTSNQKDEPAIPLKCTSEPTDKKGEQNVITEVETAVDLSKSSRVNVIVQNMCSKPSLSNGVPPLKSSHEEKAESDVCTSTANSGNTETNKELEKSSKLSIDFKYQAQETESNKFQKRSQVFSDYYAPSVISKTSSGPGLSHLQALQNMCESNEMGGIPSVIQSTNRHNVDSFRNVISESKTASSSVNFENVSKKYNFSEVHCSNNKIHIDDRESSDVLLKSNVHKNEDGKKEGESDELQVKNHSSEFNESVNEQKLSNEISELLPTDLSCSSGNKSKTELKSVVAENVNKKDSVTVIEKNSSALEDVISPDVKGTVKSEENHSSNKKSDSNVSIVPSNSEKDCDSVEEKFTNSLSQNRTVLENFEKDDVEIKSSDTTKNTKEQNSKNCSKDTVETSKIDSCKSDASSKLIDSNILENQTCLNTPIIKKETFNESLKEFSKDDKITASNVTLPCSSDKSKSKLLKEINTETCNSSPKKSETDIFANKKEISKSVSCGLQECKDKSLTECADSDCSTTLKLDSKQPDNSSAKLSTVRKPDSSETQGKVSVTTVESVANKAKNKDTSIIDEKKPSSENENGPSKPHISKDKSVANTEITSSEKCKKSKEEIKSEAKGELNSPTEKCNDEDISNQSNSHVVDSTSMVISRNFKKSDAKTEINKKAKQESCKDSECNISNITGEVLLVEKIQKVRSDGDCKEKFDKAMEKKKAVEDNKNDFEEKIKKTEDGKKDNKLKSEKTEESKKAHDSNEIKLEAKGHEEKPEKVEVEEKALDKYKKNDLEKKGCGEMSKITEDNKETLDSDEKSTLEKEKDYKQSSKTREENKKTLDNNKDSVSEKKDFKTSEESKKTIDNDKDNVLEKKDCIKSSKTNKDNKKELDNDNILEKKNCTKSSKTSEESKKVLDDDKDNAIEKKGSKSSSKTGEESKKVLVKDSVLEKKDCKKRTKAIEESKEVLDKDSVLEGKDCKKSTKTSEESKEILDKDSVLEKKDCKKSTKTSEESKEMLDKDSVLEEKDCKKSSKTNEESKEILDKDSVLEKKDCKKSTKTSEESKEMLDKDSVLEEKDCKKSSKTSEENKEVLDKNSVLEEKDCKKSTKRSEESKEILDKDSVLEKKDCKKSTKTSEESKEMLDKDSVLEEKDCKKSSKTSEENKEVLDKNSVLEKKDCKKSSKTSEENKKALDSNKDSSLEKKDGKEWSKTTEKCNKAFDDNKDNVLQKNEDKEKSKKTEENNNKKSVLEKNDCKKGFKKNESEKTLDSIKDSILKKNDCKQSSIASEKCIKAPDNDKESLLEKESGKEISKKSEKNDIDSMLEKCNLKEKSKNVKESKVLHEGEKDSQLEKKDINGKSKRSKKSTKESVSPVKEDSSKEGDICASEISSKDILKSSLTQKNISENKSFEKKEKLKLIDDDILESRKDEDKTLSKEKDIDLEKVPKTPENGTKLSHDSKPEDSDKTAIQDEDVNKNDLKAGNDSKSKALKGKTSKKPPSRKNSRNAKSSPGDDEDEIDCQTVLSSKEKVDCKTDSSVHNKEETDVSISEKEKNISDKSKIISKNIFYADEMRVYYLRHTVCLETKFKHPSCDKYAKKPLEPTTTPPVLLNDEDSHCNEASPSKTKKGSRGKNSKQIVVKKPQSADKTPPTKKSPASSSKKLPSGSRRKEIGDKSDFAIPEGFLEILGNAEKSTEKGGAGKKRKGFELKEAPDSRQSSENESTPIKRSRRIQEQHQKKMSELAVEMEREQRMLEQMAKRSNSVKKNQTPQKSPVKANTKGSNTKNNAKGSSTPVKSSKAKSKIPEIIPEEETCMESRRATRKMNSRSKNLTKMTLLYEDESKDSQFSTSRETEKSKKRKRGRGQKKGFKPWDVSSESSSSVEELTEEEEEEEPEEPLIFDVNEDEFACEEVDPNAEPVVVRRARTAKKTEVEDTTEECINDDTPCQKCGKYDKPEWILLCDKCDSGYHTHCLIPPLMLVPDGDWFCQPCEHLSLCQCLHEELNKLEVILKQKEREELRKQRLAYVGISLDNVLKPEKKEKSDESSKEEEEDDDDDETDKEQENRRPQKCKPTFEDERHQKLYGKRSVRARRNVNYQFKEYDELIFSALQEDMIEVPEEFKEEGSEAGSDKPFTAKISTRKKRSRRWKDFDYSDEEDSGEEYQGGSTDSEATAPPSSHSDQESGSGEWKIVKSKKKSQRKARSRRRRGDSSEEDWEDEVVDNDTYRPTTRRAAQKAISYREISSEEDEWGAAKRQVSQKRRKASSSEESETSFKRKSSKKKRIRKWASSDSSEESEEKSMSSSGESEEEEDESQDEESENEWKIDKKDKMRLKANTNKKVLSTDDEEEESSTQDSAPKKKAKKVISDESEEEEEDEEEEESESEENSEDDEEEEKKTEKKTIPAEKTSSSSKVDAEKKGVSNEKLENASDGKIVSIDKETSLSITENKQFQPKVLVKKELCSVDIPLEPVKQPVTFSSVSSEKAPPPPPPLKTVRKETTKMVPCVIPYEKSPKSGHASNPEEESDKEISSKEEEVPRPIPPNRPTPFPKQQGVPFMPPSNRIQFGGVLARHSVPPLASPVRAPVPPPPSNLPSRFIAPTNLSARPPVPSSVVVRHHAPPGRLPSRPVPASNMPIPSSTPMTAPPSQNTPNKSAESKPYKSTIMEPFSNMDDENESDDEVPLERIPTACAPAPLPNRPISYEKEAEYRPAAKELSSYSYAPPEEKPFPGSYSSLASFQDYSTRPSPLKPSLVETYPNNSSPSKLTPLDNYSQTSSPKGFISLDSYSENRKKKHFYGNSSQEAEPPHRPAPPPSENYQGGEIRFPPEPYPCPQSPNTYSHRSPPPNQRDPGTPPRLYSQFPDAYAPPRSPEYYQNHQYYASEERIPRPSYQPNYAPQEPSFVSNPYVATPVPQPNGGFMIDTLLRARNHEEGEDELTGVTDIVSYITQE